MFRCCSGSVEASLIEVVLPWFVVPKEEAQETRSQILEAAEKAFYERGVARTTLADIATLAGVTRGAIYWHFSNKADLVQAMLDSLREPLDEMARASGRNRVLLISSV